MGFQSQAGSVGFRTQADKGTYADPGTGGVFMRTRSGSLGGNRELLIPDPEIGGGRDVSDAYLGPVAFVGEYEFYARMESLATLVSGGLNGTINSGWLGGAAYTHEIEPTDGPLPWLSVEENIGDGYDHFRYTDAKVNTLHFEAEANGYLMGTAGLVALTQVAVPGASITPSPDFDTTPMIVGSNVTLEFDNVALPAKSFSFDLNNNLEDDDFRLGSLTLGDAVEKRREFTLGATLRPEDHDLFRQAMYGDPAATQPGGTVTKSNVTLTCQTYEVLTGGTPWSFTVEVPLAVIAPFKPEPSGDDVIEHDIEIRCLRPDPADPIATFTIVNGQTAVA